MYIKPEIQTFSAKDFDVINGLCCSCLCKCECECKCVCEKK
jgi:hypothetical protein